MGERFRLRAEPAFVGAGSGRRVGTVVVAVSLAPYEHTERIARYSTLLLDLFVLAAGVLLVRFAVGKALQPVADMTTRAAEWSEHDLDRRFDLGPPRDELTALVGHARRPARAARPRACATSSASPPRWRTSCARR